MRMRISLLRGALTKSKRPQKKQHGVFTLFVVIVLVAILGLVGLAIDTARALVVRAELQNAADACALGGALELNGLPDSVTRANAVGRLIGQRNYTGFQSTQTNIGSGDITFSNSLNSKFGPPGSSDAVITSRYIRCVFKDNGFRTTFLKLLNFDRITIVAKATATIGSSQFTCSIPMIICGSSSQGAEFGLIRGGSYTLASQATIGDTKVFRWGNIINNAVPANADLILGMSSYGACGAETSTSGNRCLGLPSSDPTSLENSWNSRFGLYKNSGSLGPSEGAPDISGYGYAPAQINNNYADYSLNRAPLRQQFQNTPKIAGYSTPANVHVSYGASYRRLTPIAIADCSGTTSCGPNSAKLLGWGCVLLLGPTDPSSVSAGKEWAAMRIEYVGRADDFTSPCRTPGVPGGIDGSGKDANGPLVPSLVE